MEEDENKCLRSVAENIITEDDVNADTAIFSVWNSIKKASEQRGRLLLVSK